MQPRLRDRLFSIQPSGNALMGGGGGRGAGADIRRAGLGALSPLPDDVLLSAVLAPLPPRDLARLCACSRALLAFADSGDLWRAHVLQDVVEEGGAAATKPSSRAEKKRLRWRGGWRETYAASMRPPTPTPLEATAAAAAPAAPSSPDRKRPRTANDNARGSPPKPLPVLYSDLLHASRRCAGLARLPRRWLERENVDRAAPGLTRAEFVERYERPNLPVILTDVVGAWPAFGATQAGNGESSKGKKRDGEEMAAATTEATAATTTAATTSTTTAAAAPWSSLSALLERTPLGASGAPVVVGNQDWDLGQYVAYARDNDDEMPLYLFDKKFCDKAPEMARHYAPPTRVFGDDLFAYLPADCRPDWRWLIAGPARSGSTFHVDPNATSAWNAVVSGSKRWVLFPPGGAPPPGVHPSPDGAEVAAPVSILEWYWAFYEAAREEEEEGEGDGGAGEEEEEEDGSGGSAEEEEEEEEAEAQRGGGGPRAATLAGRRRRRRDPRPWPLPARRMFECTVRAGEVLFVPRGWWHMALNLEEGVAVTHNFVSEVNLPYVLRFLRGAAEAAAAEEKEAAAGGDGGKSGDGSKSGGAGGGSKRHASLAQDLVSGVGLGGRALLYERFVAALREHAPEALSKAQARLEEEDVEARARKRLAAAFAPPPPQPPVAAVDADANGGKEAAAPSGAFAFAFF